MSAPASSLTEIVRTKVGALTRTTAFASWLERVGAADGDLIVINNSFVYREAVIKTSKNDQYICLRVNSSGVDAQNVFIGKPGNLNSDFKLLSAKAGNLPSLEPITDAVQAELKRVGRLIFVLIGELKDVPAEVPVNHSLIKYLRFDPSAKRTGIDTINGAERIAVVNELNAPEVAWAAVKSRLGKELGDNEASVETAFGAAFEKLVDEVRLKLVLPSANASTDNDTFVKRLHASVREQRKLYEDVIATLDENGVAADGHMREAMRIAYNFADDAITVLQLLVSVADLKGVLLWCTVKEHFDVADAFRSLPWTKSRKKPSLERYRTIISGARNRAFHNLLSFDRTIEADLTGVDVKARHLTLLAAHGQKKSSAPFDYDDRELVEILTQLTRAPEVNVSFEFWKKNAAVMESFERLLAGTQEALWALNGAATKRA